MHAGFDKQKSLASLMQYFVTLLLLHLPEKFLDTPLVPRLNLKMEGIFGDFILPLQPKQLHMRWLLGIVPRNLN
jgi:hypothetical protein